MPNDTQRVQNKLDSIAVTGDKGSRIRGTSRPKSIYPCQVRPAGCPVSNDAGILPSSADKARPMVMLKYAWLVAGKKEGEMDGCRRRNSLSNPLDPSRLLE